MLDAYRQSILISAFAGLAVGALGWLVLGTTSVNKRLDSLDSSTQFPAVPNTLPGVGKAELVVRALPLFQRPAAGATPTLRLDGISVRPAGRSALISLGGAPAKWLRQGETRGGITLVQVGPGTALIETSEGRATLSLGQSLSPTPAAPASAP